MLTLPLLVFSAHADAPLDPPVTAPPGPLAAEWSCAYPVAYPPPVATGPGTLDRVVLDRLPGVRSVPAAVALAPGVVWRGGALHAGGASASELEWRIDGLNVSDPVTGGRTPRRAGPTLPAVRGLPAR